jgi:hypothetical protein
VIHHGLDAVFQFSSEAELSIVFESNVH